MAGLDPAIFFARAKAQARLRANAAISWFNVAGRSSHEETNAIMGR